MIADELSQFQDLPQIRMNPNGPLGPDQPFHVSFQRQLSIPWSDCNPQASMEAHDMLWGQRSSEALYSDYGLDRAMPFYSGRFQRAPEPTIVHDGWVPTGTYPHSVNQVRMPSPVESNIELSERSYSSISGPLSPAIAFLSDHYYSPKYSSVSFPDFPCSDEDYSSRQNHDLLYISGPRGRSGACDTYVSLPQLQQRPDTPAEDNISLTGPRSPPSLALMMSGHVEHGSALDEDLAFRPSDSHNIEMNINHSQLASQHGHDSGIGSSATDEDVGMDADANEGDDGVDTDADADADAEAEMVTEDENGDTSAESDYEPSSTPPARRQSHGSPQRMRGSHGKASQAKTLLPNSRSRRSSAGHKKMRHGVTKPTSSAKAPRASVSKQKIADKNSPSRPFPCLLKPVCDSTFTSKNEWKRHISTRHLVLGVWRCPFKKCSRKRQTEEFPQSSSQGTAAAHDALLSPSIAANADDENMEYNTFNRKDLFAQHLRRMHMETPSGTAAPQLPDDLNALLKSEHFLIREPPRDPTCLACHKRFEGASAWDQRIECLGKHFGDSLRTDEVWQRDPDPELVAWMLQERLLVKNGQGELEFPKK